ncbi:MAG: RimK family protein [Gammaproteobacteria bacterium]|nr:RimK family protein [Gammaproteobacteria bacterium]
MNAYLVVDNPRRWTLDIPGVATIAARDYLTDRTYSTLRGAKVFNLCRSYRYQSAGYYVSLLAEARGHRPAPSIGTLQDLRSRRVVRTLSEDLDERIQRLLKPLRSAKFTLSIYFGQNVARRYLPLAQDLFALFPAPLLRAEFERSGRRWELRAVNLIGGNEVPEAHHAFVAEAAKAHFASNRSRRPRRSRARFDIAILVDPDEASPPSDERALRRFVRAADAVGLDAQLVTRNDLGRLAEFDALFIRETTAVNHHTFRFASRAEAEGLVVMDDPQSIIRCTNKVYLAELLERHDLATPRTLIVHRGNASEVAEVCGFPCVLKAPDSAFSAGVIKVADEAELEAALARFFEASDLVVAQEFMPTDFDWRVGVLDGRPLYVCRYHMAKRHWQIIRRDDGGHTAEGPVDTLAVAEAPADIVRTAVRAANLVGDGLYGVDLKRVGRRCVVIEINDNPSIDAGYEDRVMKDALYREIMGSFLRRIIARKRLEFDVP